MLGLDLLGRRALVTGGSRGVGRAVALMLANAGARVGISYHSRHDEAAAVVREMEQLGVPAWRHPGDLSERREVERLFQHAQEEFGGLDIFVGNAGIWPSDHVPVSLMADEQWHRTIAINLDSVFYCTREAARMMAADGRIVLIGSTAGQRGEAGHADYAASKGALISFVKGVAVELAEHGTTVNCVAPGWSPCGSCSRAWSPAAPRGSGSSSWRRRQCTSSSRDRRSPTCRWSRRPLARSRVSCLPCTMVIGRCVPSRGGSRPTTSSSPRRR
jgi:3-oxoacyl-[acyl-carrier protein] reductase